jgi:hypothetical protein
MPGSNLLIVIGTIQIQWPNRNSTGIQAKHKGQR